MKVSGIVFTVIVIIVSSVVAHASGDADALLKRIVEKYGKTSGLVAKFTEEGEGEKMSGTISLRGKDKFRLELTDKTIVCNGKVIWVYTSSQKRVTIDNFKQQKNSLSPEFFLAQIPADAKASIIGTPNNYIRMLLEPQTADAWGFVKSVTIDVEESNATIHRVEIVDQNSIKRDITIHSLKFDINMPESSFEFTPPKDVTVVDLR